MSKSTKVIAALGVAAGLGIAALPAASFAAQASADLGLQVTVTDYITLTVTGTETTPGTADTMTDPADDTKTILAVKTTMAPDSADFKTGTAVTTTNNVGGYTLSVAPANSGVLSNNETGTDADTIAPFANASGLTTYTEAGQDTPASFDETGWGINFSNSDTDVTLDVANMAANKYKGISGNTTLLHTASSSTTGSTTNINYGFQTKEDQHTGVYTGKVTYTAINN